MTESSGDKIAVIGAGPMGLAVAWQLLKNGKQPVVFEAGDRVGGMAACFDLNGISIERYYHFHCTSDDAFFELLDELGLAGEIQWRVTTMGYYFNGRIQDWGNPVALLRFKGLSLVAKIRYGVFAFMCTRRNEWQSLDSLNAQDWIKKWVGKEAWEILWQRLFDLKFYHFADNLSAAWIWSRIRRLGRSRYNLFKEKLGALKGGSEQYLSTLSGAIESRGGSIRLNSAVKKVVIEDGVVRGVETAAGLEAFGSVISTAPLPHLPKILPDLPAPILEQYRSIDNIGVVCITVHLGKALSPHFWLNVSDEDMDIPGVVEYTNLRSLGDGNHVVYIPYYVPGDHPLYSASDEEYREKTRRYFKRINPELSDDDFKAIHIHRYRYAQPICPPGFLDKLPPIRLPVKGLWAADTSYYYPEDRGISESTALGRQIANMACQ